APRRRGHADPAAAGPAARLPRAQADVAVGLRPRRGPRRGRRAVAGVLAPLRYRAHVPVLQAGPGLDRPAAARPGRRGPVDLADHRRLYPAAAGRAAGRGPAAALAAARPARADDPGPGPPGIPRRPRDSRHSRSPAQTMQTRPRTPERIKEPAQGTPPRRRKTHNQTLETDKTPNPGQAGRLNDKLWCTKSTIKPRSTTIFWSSAYHGAPGYHGKHE